MNDRTDTASTCSNLYALANIQGMHTRIEETLGTYLRAQEGLRVSSSTDRKIYQRAITYAMRPSKRLRPIAFLLTRKVFDPESPLVDNSGLAIATALEISHTALLAHDDVVDRDNSRSGAPTIHMSAYADGYGNDSYAVAMLTGDCLFALAPMAMLESPIPYELMVPLLIELQDCTVRTSQGQASELWVIRSCPLENLTTELIETIYTAKTNPTSAELPIALGALAAFAEPEDIMAIRLGCRPLSLAFQIMNDLVKYERLIRQETVGILPGRAIALIIRTAWERSREAERTDLARAYEGHEEFAVPALRAIQQTETTPYLHERADELFMQAKTMMSRRLTGTAAQVGMSNLVDFLRILYTPGSPYWSGIGHYPTN